MTATITSLAQHRRRKDAELESLGRELKRWCDLLEHARIAAKRREVIREITEAQNVAAD